MREIKPVVETPCGYYNTYLGKFIHYTVPEDRVCWGSINNFERSTKCGKCPVFVENQKSHLLLEKAGVFGTKRSRVINHGKITVKQGACGITVEART